MMSKIKLCFTAGMVSLGLLVKSYGDFDDVQRAKEGNAADNEMVCCMKVIIDYYRKLGKWDYTSEIAEDQEKLLNVLQKIKKVEKEKDLEDLKRYIKEGYVAESGGRNIYKTDADGRGYVKSQKY